MEKTRSQMILKIYLWYFKDATKPCIKRTKKESMLVTVPFIKNELLIISFKTCICLFFHLIIKYYWTHKRFWTLKQSRNGRKQDAAHGTIWKQIYEEPIKYLRICEVSLLSWRHALSEMKEASLRQSLLVCGSGSLLRWGTPSSLDPWVPPFATSGKSQALSFRASQVYTLPKW